MQSAAQVAPAEAPAVPVSKPIVRDVTDHVDFTGRTDAIESVNIVPRVTGYLVRIPFKEGSEVKAGDVLFEIDARPYKAQLDQAEGQVKLYQAQLQLAKTTLARDQEISKTPGAVSAQQLDQDQAAVDEAEARVKAYQASTEVYKLNLSFTKVTSPITGRSAVLFTSAPGNLVNQDQTLLTTIVSLDPMWVYFDMDEPTLLRMRRAVNEGRIKMPEDGIVPVYMGLQGEDGYPHEGTIDFVNNQVNSTTGSISVRGVFPNPKPDDGRAAAVAGHVRARSDAARRAALGPAGHRPGHQVGSRAEKRLRRRRREQGPGAPDHDRDAARRRPARDRRAASRPSDRVVVGGAAASARAHGDSAGEDRDADHVAADNSRFDAAQGARQSPESTTRQGKVRFQRPVRFTDSRQQKENPSRSVFP